MRLGVSEMTPERCLTCSWFNHQHKACDRIFKAQVIVVPGAGEITLDTQRGLMPPEMEDDFTQWVVKAIGDVIDAWPGWQEWQKLKDKKGCAAKKQSMAIEEFGQVVRLKVVREADPLKNLDKNGLFRSDISVW